jgi:hypothetical protein
MKKTKKGFMCGIAFLDELEKTSVSVFPSKQNLLASHGAAKECGVAEVTITFKRWVKKPKV